MTRVLEAALLLAPLAAYVLWRLLAWRGVPNPSRQTLLILFVAVVLLGGSLVWTSVSERSRGDTRYVPAQFENGRVVPGHGA